jgi:hypothetical protein
MNSQAVSAALAATTAIRAAAFHPGRVRAGRTPCKITCDILQFSRIALHILGLMACDIPVDETSERNEQPPGRALPSRQVPVTAAWQTEMQRRRTAYEQRRARWTEAWRRGTTPEPPLETDQPRARSRTIFDKRQYRFDF